MERRLKILHFEDSNEDAELLREHLAAGGIQCDITLVQNKTGFENTLHKQWDIILSDFNIPEFDGFAALELVRTRVPHTPFILISGTIGEELAIESLKNGATDYILKDKLARLVPAIHRALQEAEEHRLREESQKAFIESEEKYRKLVCSMQEGLLKVDNDDVIQFVNDRLCLMFGYQRDELLGRVAYRLFATEEEQALIIEKNRRRMEGISEQYEMRCRHKDGHYVWMEISGSPVVGAGGVVIGSVATFSDITERKRVEELLRDAEARYRALFEQSPYGVLLVDAETGKTLEANETASRQLGYTREEFANLTISDYEASEHPEETAKRMQKVFREGMDSFETSQRTKSGEIRNMHVWAKTIQLKGRTAFYGIVQDITERKRAAEALWESELRFRTVWEKSTDGMRITDEEGTVVLVNDAYCKMVEKPREEIEGKPMSVIFEKDKQAVALEKHQERFRSRSVPPRLERDIILWNGKRISLELSNTFLEIPHRRVLLLSVVRDITEHKKLQEQILRNQRLESIGTLAGGIAHDLNNVLAPILMSIQMLRKQHKDSVSERVLSILEASAKRGAEVVRQVLTFARGVEGEHKLLQPGNLILEVENFVRETFPKTIRLQTSKPDDLKAIKGNATQLYQVLLNLCVNARDAMPSGGTLNLEANNIVLDENYVHFHADARPGPYIQVSVSDTGMGIPKKLTNKIFDPFFTTKETGKGTGLGLSTALGIVKSHGGFITVYSEVGKGTRFSVYFPAAEPRQAVQLESKKEQLPLGHGELLLVVDDEAFIREMTKAALEAHGYNVLLAENGFEALSKFRQHQRDIRLVITDIAMPEMDGHAAIREIRKISPAMKIIGISGLAGAEDLKKTAAPDTQAFLTKPFSVEQLLTILEKHL